MAFEPKTFDHIFEAMRDRTPPSISDFEEGSVARTLYESFAFELALLYEQMQQVYQSAFVDSANGSHLDRVVAVLGIQRGEPDFATGVVNFERDLGLDETIDIPIGFLVSTSEDSEETQKKSYQTIETRTLEKSMRQIGVRVQAIRRGETEATAAATIQVMPQPLPGIKAITNEQPIQFTGKRRETDDELRDRAKASLLAASSSNIHAIENALFSLPGVREVRVQENFHEARGSVVLEWLGDGSTGESITIPKKTLLTLQSEPKSVLTQETIRLDRGTPQTVSVAAVVQSVAGQILQENAHWKPLELTGSNNASNNPAIAIAIRNPDPILLKDFGVIEVFIDGVNFKDVAQVRQLEQTVERVRAAGVYVLLKPTQQVQVDGVFLVELKPGQRLSIEERLTLEQQLQTTLMTYLSDQRIGQPLLMSQITQKLLEPKAINDLVKFELTTYREQAHQPEITTYDDTTRRLEAEVLEKFVPRYLRVVSEIKPLIVQLQIKIPTLDETRQHQIEQAIQDYFDRLSPTRPVIRDRIQSAIHDAIGANPELLLLKPQLWNPAIAFDSLRDHQVPVSLVEQAQLGDVFLYQTDLMISGAMKLTLPLTTPQNEQTTIQAQVRQSLQTYLDQLKPEESVDINRLSELAKAVQPVIEVAWKAEDFVVMQSGGRVPDRIDKNVIRVTQFEKAQLAESFAIVNTIQSIPVRLTQIVLGVEINGLIPNQINRTQLEAVLNRAIQAALEGIRTLPQPSIAEALSYQTFKDVVLLDVIRNAIAKLSPAGITALIHPSEIESLRNLDPIAAGKLAELSNTLLQGAKYTIRQLLLNDRSQDIFIRVIERASLQPLDLAQVSIRLELPIATPGGSI